MKAKLLKKLRKKYLKKYGIYQAPDNSATIRWKRDSFFDEIEYCSTLDDAKARLIQKVREDIFEELYNLKGRINFNPWK